MERASTASAWLSGTGETYNGSLWLKRVANKSTLGNLSIWNTELPTDWSNALSVLIGLSNLDRRSAEILNLPVICRTLITMSCSWQKLRISHTSTHRSRECVSPCLLIKETTVVLSVDIMRQEWWINDMACFSAKRMAIISNKLIRNWDWSSVQRPWKDSLIGSKWAPHQWWLASVKRNMFGCGGGGWIGIPTANRLVFIHHCKWNRIMPLVAIGWSRGKICDFQSGRWHICKGRKWSLPRYTKSAAAVSLPKRERKDRANTCLHDRIDLIVSIRVCTRLEPWINFIASEILRLWTWNSEMVLIPISLDLE